jgi:hypothetical protein
LLGVDASRASLVAHVSACTRCSARLEELIEAVAEDRRRVIGEADRGFSSLRLEHQRAAILRRIGGSRAAARILPFPAPAAAAAQPRRQRVRRWGAAAAVATLIVGAGAGRFLGPRSSLFPAYPSAPPYGASVAHELETLQASVATDEAFLLDFEASLGTPHVEPLRVLDELTPAYPEGAELR